MNYKKFLEQSKARNAEIYRLHRSGISFADLARKYKLSHPRIRAICKAEADK